MLDTFIRHPRSVGETYGEHFATAAGFGGAMVLAGLACMVHAWLPFLFERTASQCVSRLHRQMADRQAKAAASRDVRVLKQFIWAMRGLGGARSRTGHASRNRTHVRSDDALRHTGAPGESAASGATALLRSTFDNADSRSAKTPVQVDESDRQEG